MRSTVLSLAGASALLLSGCQTAPPPDTASFSNMSKCDQVAFMLADNRISEAGKMAAMEVGRNEGCFGAPQPQRVQIQMAPSR